MLWLTLHFPALSLEIFRTQTCTGPGIQPSSQAHNRQTDLKTDDVEPVLIVLQDNRVYMRNTTAQHWGIEAGSTLATAHSICPDLKYMQRDIVVEGQRLAAVADALYRFSSYVSIQAPDCIVLEIGASLKLFDSHQHLQQAAVDLCNTLGHSVCARVSATPAAGIAMARAGQNRLTDVPLSHAGLELAGVPANTIERFANMGIYTLGPLLDLPAKQLGQRFGKPLLKYLAQLTGDMPDPRQAIKPAATFSQQLHLLEPLRNKDELYLGAYSPMRKLAAELQQWLITHQLGCEQLIWKFTSCNHELAYLPVRFAKGRQNQDDFIRVSQLKLEQTDLPGEVLGISLNARQLAAWQNHSRGLFHNTEQHTHELSELVDELRARLGDLACQGVLSVTEHTPEAAWQGADISSKTFTRKGIRKDIHKGLQKKSTRKNGTATNSTGQANADRKQIEKRSVNNRTHAYKHKRPMWLFAPPRRIHLAELDLLHGPERIQGQWWDQQVAQQTAQQNIQSAPATADIRHAGQQKQQGCENTWRDYYIAKHRFGIECWVFVDLNGHWYLHGYFG